LAVTLTERASQAPTDEEVRRWLERDLRVDGATTGVSRVARHPYLYATSFRLEELHVTLDDGRALHLILKDLTWDALLSDAQQTKPRFLYEPRREIETYRRILSPRDLGPALYGAVVDKERGRCWLLIEKVGGVELSRTDDFSLWMAAARWLARFHRSFEGGADTARRLNPYLLHYDSDFFHLWAHRALEFEARRGMDPGTVDRLQAVAARYDEVVTRLTALPAAFIHGEFYAPNVLVHDSGTGASVWPVDWEMAGVGPPLLDLAALVSGWSSGHASQLVEAYVGELGSVAWGREELAWLLDGCRLHYALQWLGWSPAGLPSLPHAPDWAAEALELGARLGL
jgi:hypothetical protein